MHLIIPSYEPAAGEGFGKDLFNRKPFATSLTNLVRRTNDPLVISLNGHWGEGKTTFVKAWQTLLDENNVPNIYIDAFASDYVDDAFMVVAGAITDYVQQKIPKDKTEVFLDKAKHVGAHLLSLSTKIGIRAATAGIVSGDDFKDLDKAVEGAGADISKSAEEYIKQKLINHKKESASIIQFKKYLSTIPNLLKPKTDHSLTIIIDELDRCRPSFAVEMLEKIKHLFSVNNITFVLVINKTQLQESIRATYGTNIDAHTYLQKFLTIEADIPLKGLSEKSTVSIYCEYLAEAHDLDDKEDVQVLMAALGDQLGMTLRQMERAFSIYALTSLSGRMPRDESIGLFVVLCVIKVTHPDIFFRIKNDTITYSEIYKTLNYIESGDKEYPHELNFSLKWLKALIISNDEYVKLPEDDYSKQLFSRGHRRNRKKMVEDATNRISTFNIS
ncbi:KAP-like P-loop domain-containing protein [Pseudomonas baetica]|uniref:KAP-like P-loop domain-containing protein n=1 Tax=Pseudomonas baetica TaxID=674054 RepID=A0ABX4PQV4_9PSED|nr:P-loop NTPase fold protein [Pseudomonas baetica]PKA67416.1 KAP-like P-loop domain-containing protein [Pseudomonas baetica]